MAAVIQYIFIGQDVVESFIFSATKMLRIDVFDEG